MASFDEIRKKMESKYGGEEDGKKALEEKKGTFSSSSDSAKSSTQSQSDFDTTRAKMEKLYNLPNRVDSNYINTFISDAKKYLGSAESDYKRVTYSTSSDLYTSRRATADDLRTRSSAIRQYLEKNKPSINKEYYDSLTSYLDEFGKASNLVMQSFYGANQHYSQFETEDDYNSWVDYSEKLNFDTNAGQKEIAMLENVLAEYKANTRWETDDKGKARAEEIRKQYGGEDEIEALIAEKKAYLSHAKRIQEGEKLAAVTGNEDFDANSGYVSTKSEGLWDEMWSQFRMGYDDLTYEYINGEKNGMRQAIINKAVSYDADTEDFFVYDHMTDDQIAIYNYYYTKDGKATADKYLDSIRESLNHQSATERFKKMEDNVALELFFGIEAGVDQFQSGMKGALQAITGEDDYIPATATQIASGMVREDLSDDGFKLPEWMGGASLGQVAYDTTTTTANMLPSILTSTVSNFIVPGSGAVVGSVMMGTSAAGNGYQEMLNLGYDKGQARAYATMVGASEAGLQYLLGGISAMGGKLSGNAVGKLLSGIDNAFARTAIKLGGNMLSEGIEEGLQEIITPWLKNLAIGANVESVNWSEVAYSSLLGALTAGFMEGGGTISGEANNYKTGKQLKAADISAERLAELGKTFSADTVAHQLAGRVNENTGAYTLGRLFNEIGAALSEQNVTEITNALVAKGMDRKNARKNAEALDYVVEGGQLTERQVAVIEANDILAEVARTTLVDANTTWNQRSKGYNEMLKTLAEEMTSPKASRANPARQSEENVPTTDTVDTQTENDAESASEADAVDTSPAKVKSISAIKNGQATIKLEDGSEVNVSEADLDPDDGVRIENIASIDGISTEDANFILNTLRASTGASAQMDSLGAKEAYKYGFYGFSQEHIAKHGVFANTLTETQRQAIYEAGQKARASQVAAKQATVKKSLQVAKDSSVSGKVHFEGDRSTLTERQSASLTAMEKVAEVLGVQIYVFESQVNERGKRVGANGWYDPKDHSIHIDLHAGANGEGTMLFTAAHELTHFIRQWSPAKFKVLADFLMEEYGKKGVNVDALVREQMAKAKRNGRTISYDTAYEEVVADSMETMLADGNVMEKLAKLKAQDKSLWQKIKGFINELATKVRAVYEGMSPDSVEGRHVAEMVDAIERLQDLFTEGLVEASENFQSAEKNTTKDGGGIKYMSRDVESVTEETVRSDLTDVFNGNNVAAASYIPLAKTTPFAVRYITGYMEDRPIIVDKKKAYFDMREDGKFKEDSSHHYHGMGIDGFLDALVILNDPEFAILEDMGDGKHHYAFISSNENGEEICVVFQMNVTKSVGQMNGYPGGYYNLDITEFVATDEWLEEHGVEPGTSYKDYLLSFPENSIAYDRSIHFEQLEKARLIDSESAGLAASYDNNRASGDKVTQPDTIVKNESVEAMDVEVDEKTGSVAPAVLFSERTWTESDYVQEREKAAQEIAKAIGVSEKKAKAYIDSVNSIAKMIADDRVRLDYFSSPGRSSFVGNVEYGGSFDFSTLCKKRRLLTGTFTAIQKALPDTALTANEILDIRNRMKKAGLEVSCGLCYVEGSRANMGQFAKEFIRLYKQYYPDTWQPNMADVNTPDGIEWVRINHPECYEQYEYFWNHYGTLKTGDKNLFASQQKPKLYQLHTEYKGEILQKFKDDDNVEEKNLNGGIRLQSFSDFEIVHLIDTMQIIMDMSRVGLAGQAYTKVPDFAWALGDTGLKINLSLIAKGVDENGKLIFDDVEGMPIDEAMKLRDRYSKNVGTILVAFNDEQLLAAMADDRVDFIIPFHRSQWKKSQYEAMGLPAKAKDYTFMQNEKFIKPQYHEYRGRMVKDKTTNYMPNEYWDFSKSGKENAEAYLEMCARNNKRPKFYKLLQNNGDGSYSLKADGSTDGYWKLLIDFKMYDNDGKGSPQMAVKPEFNMDEAQRMLNDYKGGHSNFPVAQGIVDDFVKEYKDSHEEVMYSERDDTPTFYSQMGKVVEGMKQERSDDSVSNRSLLANALEVTAKNDIEKQKIQEYKGKIDLINAEERKLSELNEQIKKLSFSKGPRDTKAIRDLQFEAKKTANRINTYDKQLLRLEASKPLQDVLQREKKAAYKRAEQKGKEALEAYREKAIKTQQELREKWQESRKKGVESRNKTAMRHKIQSVVGELNQLLLNGDKKRHVPENLKKAVADALALVNMDTVGAEERAAKYAALIAKETDPDKIDAYTTTMENILRQGEKMGQRLKELRDAYEEISNSDDPDIANAYDPVIAGSLKELAQSIGDTSLRDMTLEQLSDVYDMYRMVLTRVRDANKSLLNDKNEAISDLASKVVGEVRRVGGEHKYRAAVLDSAKKFGWDNLKPVYAFEHIGSATLTDAFNNVRSGEDVWAMDVTEARNYYLDKAKKYGYDSWDFKKKYRFESTSGLAFELTLDQILSLYAYSKREQAHDHLRLGGFVFDSNIETYKEKGSKLVKYKVNTADAHQITPEILADIIGNLSKEQAAFVDEMQDYLSAVMGAKGNEVTMKMYGVKLFKEKFYFPLKSAKQFMFEQNEVSGEVKIKNSGFTNKVVAKANNPVILSNFLDVWAGHVNDMSMYHAFVLPLEDFSRIFNYNSPKKEGRPPVSVKGTIQNAYSPAAVNYVRQLITDLNGGARTDSTTGFINKMMGLFKKGSVFASLSVVIQQPSAIARAAALLDTKYFIGPKVDHKRHKALWDEVKQHAPVAIIKEMGYFDTNMGKSTQDFILAKEYDGFKEKMAALVTDSGYRDEALSKAPALADEIAWCGIWEAVKRETKAKNPEMDVKSEAFMRKAGDRFTEVIVKTQVYDSVLSRSGLMRSKDTGMKMATAFMAEPTTSINMIADALLQGKRGNRKYCRTAIGAVIASQILNSILVSFVYAGRDDDEDETYVEKYIGTLSGEVLDSLNPMTYIPFIKDTMSILQGYDVERSDMAVISDLWNAIQNLSKDNVSVYRKVEDFAGSVAQIFGLPVKNIMRDARGIYQTVISFVNGQHTTKAGIGYAVKGAVTGKDVSNQQQLYEAYLSGDKTQIARVEGRYKDQSAINSAIRKALRENDPRIKEAAAAKFNGDLDEYLRIAKEIIGEKHFDQDNVVAAINAEINALDKGEATTSTSKASGMFKAEDFAVAVAQGDSAMAYAIKTDILQTAQKNGKTAEEAEKNFVSSAISACKELFDEGEISERQATNALVTYCGKTEIEAISKVRYWAFKQEHPDTYVDDAWIDEYYEDVEHAGISIDVFVDYRNRVKDITGEGKKDRRMAIINSMPISSHQKDALYYAEGWAESTIADAPWH